MRALARGERPANQLNCATSKALDTPEYVYLYLYLLTLDGRLFPVHGLPPQGAVSPPEGAPWTRQIKPLLEGALRDVQQTRPVDIDVAVRVQITYSALSAIAAELSRVPGHKNIVWITDGVPIELGPNRSDTGDFVDFTPLLRQMSDEFDRSGVAIYPVRQIMLGTPTHIDDGPAPAPANGAAGMGSMDTLDQFAELTGGRPDAGKDIGAAVRQAINDARTSYQIGYYPPETNWDDKYHKLRVTCTRKGVRIQAKTGYYAWREGPGAKAEEAIESTIPTTFDAAEIGLRATLSSDPKGGGTSGSRRASTHKTSSGSRGEPVQRAVATGSGRVRSRRPAVARTGDSSPISIIQRRGTRESAAARHRVLSERGYHGGTEEDPHDCFRSRFERHRIGDNTCRGYRPWQGELAGFATLAERQRHLFGQNSVTGGVPSEAWPSGPKDRGRNRREDASFRGREGPDPDRQRMPRADGRIGG